MDRPERIDDIANEMRNPQLWWERYRGMGADCDVLDSTDLVLKSYAKRLDAARGRVEGILHTMGEVAGELDVAGPSGDWTLVKLCQRCRERILGALEGYWKENGGCDA